MATDAKTRLAEIRGRMSQPVLPAPYAADVPWLLERIAHLEGLLARNKAAKIAAGMDLRHAYAVLRDMDEPQ